MDPRTILRLQGAYYAATGIWSLVGIRSFQKVTGPKEDVWLVKTVGALVTAMGFSFMRAAREDAVSPETRLLSKGSAAALAGIGTYYPLMGRISPVYLLDAVAELAILRAWRRAA